MHEQDLRETRRLLLRWYGRARRDLPWRHTRDAYRIWVSEIMLQQTRVEAVTPHYTRFLRRFPDVQAVAAAPLDEVLLAWTGLGYYSRARNLHAAARRIVAQHGGRLPRQVSQLRGLPGIGEYTAGAIASIAFGLPEPVVDGNVQRLFARLLAWNQAVDRAATRRHFRDLAARFACSRHPGDVNQALMELGALVCTPASPGCDRCPLRPRCRAHALGHPTAFPAPRRQAPLRDTRLAALLVRCGSALLLVRRRSGRLLRDWWEVPLVHLSAASDASQPRRVFRGRAGFDTGPLHRLSSPGTGKLRHGILSHRIQLEFFEARLQHRRRPRPAAPAGQAGPARRTRGATPLANLELDELEWRWTSSDERRALPLSTLARKVLRAAQLDSTDAEEKTQRRRDDEAPQRRQQPAE